MYLPVQENLKSNRDFRSKIRGISTLGKTNVQNFDFKASTIKKAVNYANFTIAFSKQIAVLHQSQLYLCLRLDTTKDNFCFVVYLLEKISRP